MVVQSIVGACARHVWGITSYLFRSSLPLQPPKLTRAAELSLCGSCFGEEEVGCPNVPGRGGGEVAEGSAGRGVRSERTGVVDSGAALHRPDLPSLNPAQNYLTDPTPRSTPLATASSSLQYTVQSTPVDVGADWKGLGSEAANSSSSAAAARRNTSRVGSGLAVRGPSCVRDGGGGAKSAGECPSEDKENSATRFIVERQEKQLQALQEKVRGTLARVLAGVTAGTVLFREVCLCLVEREHSSVELTLLLPQHSISQ